MPSLEEVHKRIQEKKKERREINKSFQDELKHNSRYQEIVDEMKTLREEKKGIEEQIQAASSADSDKLDLLKLDIKSDTEMLSDIVLTKLIKQEPIEIIDEEKNRWVPNVSVSYKKEEDAGTIDRA